jgi:hypothetical protein
MQIKLIATLVLFLISYSLTAQNSRKMKSIQTEIIINASKEKVWQALTDFENYPNWNTFIVSIEGELKEGARLKNKLMLDGKENNFTPKILKVVPNEHFEWLGKAPLGTFNGQHYFKLESVSPTQTKLIHGEKFSGWLRGLIMRKIGTATRDSFIQMNKNLKKLVES